MKENNKFKVGDKIVFRESISLKDVVGTVEEVHKVIESRHSENANCYKYIVSTNPLTKSIDIFEESIVGAVHYFFKEEK